MNEAEREIRMARTFDAPRERVFEVWTDPSQVGYWWGPNGFKTTTASMEVRPGGQWRYVMHGPDGTDYDNLVTYREVNAPEWLAYAHGVNDADPEQFTVTVRFEDVGERTHVDMRLLFPTKEARDRVAEEFGAIEGANQTLGRLARYLEQQPG